MYWDGLIFVAEHSWNSQVALVCGKPTSKCVGEESSLLLCLKCNTQIWRQRCKWCKQTMQRHTFLSLWDRRWYPGSEEMGTGSSLAPAAPPGPPCVVLLPPPQLLVLSLPFSALPLKLALSHFPPPVSRGVNFFSAKHFGLLASFLKGNTGGCECLATLAGATVSGIAGTQILPQLRHHTNIDGKSFPATDTQHARPTLPSLPCLELYKRK